MRILFYAATLSLALSQVLPAVAQEMKMPRAITVVGHGETRMAPDMAVVTVGVLKQGTTAAEALAANTASMKAVIDALKSAGIDTKDMQTSNFMVAPRYDYSQTAQPAKLVGYDVSNNLAVTVRKLDQLGGLLDTLVSAGSNQINGVNFMISKPDLAMDSARRLATEDATRKAKLYTSAASVRLGRILSISEAANTEPPVPMRMRAAAAPAEMSADVPVETGEQILSVDVNISWEIE